MNFQKTNRSAYLNFLRSQYEKMTGEILVKSYPYYIHVDPISICQLRCPSCPTGVENENKRIRQPISLRDRTRMSKDMFFSLLDEVGENLFFLMLYNWGEPLLNRDLPLFIRKAKEYQICVEIHTNLSLHLEDEFMEDLLTSGLDVIAASIDGFSQESYQIYRRGGRFELAKKNIERLATLRHNLGLHNEIIWNYLVFSFNEHEIKQAQQYCDKIGITFNQREAFIANPDWLPRYRQNEADHLRNPSEMPETNLATDPLQSAQKPSSCAWHYGYSVVNSNGSVSPCCAPWEQKYDFGFIQPGLVSFGDIWNNSSYRKSRGAFANKAVPGLHKVDTLCVHCPYGSNVQNLYSGYDIEVANQFHRAFDGKDPLLEKGMLSLKNREEFINFYIQHMGELVSHLQIHDNDNQVVVLPTKPSPSSRFHFGFGLYLKLKDDLKPFTARLFNKFPALYQWGKSIERKFVR
jgi:MoaA/NifB/PqqE/SkfB family radical SAM enzyme